MEADEVEPVLTDFVRDWMEDKPELHAITIHKVIDSRSVLQGRPSDVVGRIILNNRPGDGFCILGYIEDDRVEVSYTGELCTIYAADPDFFDKLYEVFVVALDSYYQRRAH